MSQWSKIVENIMRKANFTSCDSMPMNFDTLSKEQQETVYKIRQKQLNEAVLQDVENTYNKYTNFFENASGNTIKLILEKDKSDININDQKILYKIVDNIMYKLIMFALYRKEFKLNTNKSAYEATVKAFDKPLTIKLIANQGNGAGAWYRPSENAIYIPEFFDKNGRFDEQNALYILNDVMFRSTLVHELAHLLKKQDDTARNISTYSTDMTNKKQYHNNQNELNSYIKQFITYLDDYFEKNGDIILNNGFAAVNNGIRKEYTTYQWISEVINKGMNELRQNNKVVNDILNDLSDSHFKKLYKDITDYFVKKYAKTAINNTDKFNDWLSKHK